MGIIVCIDLLNLLDLKTKRNLQNLWSSMSLACHRRCALALAKPKTRVNKASIGLL